MATVNAINHKRQNPGTMGRVVKYVMQEAKTLHDGRQLVSGRDCTPETAFLEFMTTKQMHRKIDGRGFYHFVQSFHPQENVTPDQAHEIALELAKRFDGFEVLVATHVDAEHIHSHLVVNSVSHTTGKKLHQNRENLMEHRRVSDTICRAHGLSILPEPGQKQSAGSLRPREYRAALQGDSWKFRLMNAIDYAMARSRMRKDFMAEMKKLGYEVAWTAGRKSITYTSPNGMRCRDKRLHDAKYLKENMEAEFEYRSIERAEPARNFRTAEALSAGGLRRTGGAMGGHVDPAWGEPALAAGDGGGAGTDRQHKELARPIGADSLPLSSAGETGWEQSRRDLEAYERGGGFTAEGAGAGAQAVSHLAADGLSLAGSVARLAGNLGEVIREPEHKSSPKVVYEHKRGIGQKQDDHSGWELHQY